MCTVPLHVAASSAAAATGASSKPASSAAAAAANASLQCTAAPITARSASISAARGSDAMLY